MANPSLPQSDTPEQQAQRKRDLAWAQTQYRWAHSYTYDTGEGEPLVLEPIAILEVNEEQPLPSSQKLTLVQIFDIITVGLELIGNTLVRLGNLIDVGAVQLDPAPPEDFSIPAETDGESKPSTESCDDDDSSEGLLGRIGDKLKNVVEAVGDKVKGVVEDGVHEVENDVKQVVAAVDRVVHVARDVDRAVDTVEAVEDISKDLKALVNELETHRKQGESVLTKAHDWLSGDGTEDANDPSYGHLIDELIAGSGTMFENVLKTLLGDVFKRILAAAGLYGQAPTGAAFADQFQTVVVPNVVATTMSDACFARMRVAGPNPLLIRKVDALPEKFPVDKERFAALTGESLEQALASGRVFLVDYEKLAHVTAGDFPAGQKYISAPYALFVRKDGHQSASPVAIQCGREPGNSNPVFYRDDGESWELAKLHVQSADGNYHELISHLGLTHLLIEPFAVASHRNLAQQHPVYLLLLPHFQGTMFINNAALTSLINPGGTVDMLLAGTIEADWKVTTNALASLDFNAHMLPANLETRGVADKAVLPEYPYRDDALLVWGAIESWVRDYLSIYYNSDADIVGDTELQAWYRDLVSPDGGCIKGLGEPLPDGGTGLCSFAYLVRVVTMVIFTSSAQHASVNFPQLFVMSYSPAMPLATYAPPPIQISGELPANTDLAHLPPLQMSYLQLLVGQLLGGIYFTRLGQYDRHQRGSWFTDPRVAEPLAAFQNNLVAVEREIGARNLERPTYEPLLPSRIPQSINI